MKHSVQYDNDKNHSISPFNSLDLSRVSFAAKISLVEANGSGVGGTLYLAQDAETNHVTVTGEIEGLEDGNHGFHIHAVGDLGNNCANAAGHYNPDMVRFWELYRGHK